MLTWFGALLSYEVPTVDILNTSLLAPLLDKHLRCYLRYCEAPLLVVKITHSLPYFYCYLSLGYSVRLHYSFLFKY